MPDDLPTVILCELGERVIAMREALADPSVASKPHARAVAALLGGGLDALEARLQRDVLRRQRGAEDATPAILDTLYQCGQALRALHSRLGLLDMRWSAASVDIFLRKLRDEVGADLPHPAVVLTDDYAALDDDVAESLHDALRAAGVDVDNESGTEPAVALPRIESVDPLTWPLLSPALARLFLSRYNGRLRQEKSAPSLEEDPSIQLQVAVRLLGPAAFAARAVYELLFAPVALTVDRPDLQLMRNAALSMAGGLDAEDRGAMGQEESALIGLFAHLLRARDDIFQRDGTLGYGEFIDDALWAELGLDLPDVPTVEETAVLLDKLVAGTPINAIDPPVPADFLERLEGVDNPDDFYALIGPLGERPASLATILGVGWLYKVRYSYPLFGQLIEEHADVARILAAYRPHLLERTDLLAQSIEAAHVQGIFMRGRLAEDGSGRLAEDGPGRLAEDGSGRLAEDGPGGLAP